MTRKSKNPESEPAPTIDGKPVDALKFEEALAALEGMVERLETGEMSLEESVEAFETGMRLVKACAARLDEAERRVEILVGNETRPFEDAERDDED